MQLILEILLECVKFIGKLLGKTYGLRYQNVAVVNDSLAYSKTKASKQHGLYVLEWTF